MDIKGFQSITIVDFPGRISSIVFTPGCNFRCPYCYNVPLVLQPHTLPTCTLDDLLSLLNERKEFIDGVVITGGEPTLHSDLFSVLSTIHRHFPLLKIKLDTNGSCPDNVQKMLEAHLVDYIALDFKMPFSDYHLLCAPEDIQVKWGKTQSLLRRSFSMEQYEYRTTLFGPFFNLEKLKDMGNYLLPEERWCWQNYFSAEKTIDPGFAASAIPYSILNKWKEQLSRFSITVLNS